MSRIAILLTSLMLLVGELAISVPRADACGVKLALKRPKQHKAKGGPIAAGVKPVVAQRQARTPIAAGPTVVTPRRAIVEAKPIDTGVTPTPPVPEKEKVTPQKEKVAVAPPTVKATTKTSSKKKSEPKSEPTPEPSHVATTTTTEPAPAPVVSGDIATLVSLGEEVYFKPDKADLTNTIALDRAVVWLNANRTVTAIVEGHADPSGNPATNQKLSEQRAEAVRSYLVSKGIDAARLEPIGFGDTKAKFAPNDGRNRRVWIRQKR